MNFGNVGLVPGTVPLKVKKKMKMNFSGKIFRNSLMALTHSTTSVVINTDASVVRRVGVAYRNRANNSGISLHVMRI